MQRHSGTLPARRYGPRSRQNQNANRLNSAARSSSQFPAAASETRATHGHKGPSAVDEESLSSVEHSLDSSGAIHSQSSQNLLSPPVVTEAAHSALKHATQSRDHQQHQHQQLQSEQRNNPIAPIAVQFNSRFYSPNSTITAPLAHTATWLASGAASAVAGMAASSKARQYDSFLSSYAGFAQHPGQHLTRLTLLPSASHAMDHHHHHHQSAAAGDESGKSRGEGLQMQSEYGSQQPNPDFSQLLD